MFQKHIHEVKFYPSADDFTQAPLVMLVTNIMSGKHICNPVCTLRKGDRKNTFFLGLCPKLWVGGGQKY